MNLSFDLPLGVDGRINLTNESKVRILSNGMYLCLVSSYDEADHFIVFYGDGRYFNVENVDASEWGLTDRELLKVRAQLKESYREFIVDCLMEAPITALIALLEHPDDLDLTTRTELGYLASMPKEHLPEVLLRDTIITRDNAAKSILKLIHSEGIIS